MYIGPIKAKIMNDLFEKEIWTPLDKTKKRGNMSPKDRGNFIFELSAMAEEGKAIL